MHTQQNKLNGIKTNPDQKLLIYMDPHASGEGQTDVSYQAEDK